MKTIILAGGLGTRLSEFTSVVPKPMVEVGGKPILYHVMNHYARYGHNDFLLALGYKSEVIKKYFTHGVLTLQAGGPVSADPIFVDENKSDNVIVYK